MTEELTKINSWKSFGGEQAVYKHHSIETGCEMTFAVFIPKEAGLTDVPVLWYLSGLTCTHANVMEKGHIQQACATHGIMAVMPDTSPRGDEIPNGGNDDYDLGLGAGFYVDATQPPWSDNYRMYSYIVNELPAIIKAKFPADSERQSIMGHSMGGHGALVIALREPQKYLAASAFAPIVNPSATPWGQKAFSSYLGNNNHEWRKYDAVCLIEDGAKFPEFLVDQGRDDAFIERELQPEKLEKVCFDAGINLSINYHDGYDHSYYFISTFIESQIAWHKQRLGS